MVQFESPSTDGGDGAGEHNHHESEGLDTLMGCPGLFLRIFFWERERFQVPLASPHPDFIASVCGFVSSQPGFHQEATKSSG